MDLPLAQDRVALLVVLDEVPSTNDELVARAATQTLDEFTVIASLNQTAGRGRLGRTWAAPPGTSLAVSVLLRPRERAVPLERYGWIPLLAGRAMATAVGRLVPSGDVALKWPNDVLIGGRKVAGVLSELLPDARSVVVGAGVNLTIPTESLPVPTATSLLLNGATASAEELADLALVGYLDELKRGWQEFTSATSDADFARFRAGLGAACSSLGRSVQVSLPDGSHLVGTAVDLDDAGRLRLRVHSDGSMQTVAAGDVTHLRYE
ncbi:BirA family biotin operon repressor/biotin-[acetyl-CoA-carboxylase] ligase [Cryobacterium mesophilum]|uniref:biotin--[biotin carboxyl-carrier protein] ligase n=1 Tax=Terrimesophilobacter mesophilus TaxID=433647 RepID=A0A4R8V9S3_9MICO|nr:biotin--[acetyl-CoA-carboxylase] ligase [Terrimesophilobacter mesophilus]MBB5632685.1 BirA family biotin operon repressor/biotin-[acetyl-CoA-carboxylase] ligase [Terrimesophilobacter mesophilus]TFB79493.1 biotin--[acetyl-CoA-carboxylase] ligase [Terrimesophilobacter mesophilus]